MDSREARPPKDHFSSNGHSTIGGSAMTKSFLIVAALAFTVPPVMAQVQNAGPSGSTGGNNVNATLDPPTRPAPATSAPQAPAPSVSNTYGPSSYAPGYGATAQTTGTVDPASYRTAAECVNAAETARASMEPCKLLPQK
jgi:hypothetical protein